MPSLSLPTLLMCRDLIDGQQIPANHPQLLSLAQQIATGRAEIEAAIEAATEAPPAPEEAGE